MSPFLPPKEEAETNAISQQSDSRASRANWTIDRSLTTKVEPKGSNINALNYGTEFIDFTLPEDARRVRVVGVYTDLIFGKEDAVGIFASWAGKREENGTWTFSQVLDDVIPKFPGDAISAEQATKLEIDTNNVLLPLGVKVEHDRTIPPNQAPNSGYDVIGGKQLQSVPREVESR